MRTLERLLLTMILGTIGLITPGCVGGGGSGGNGGSGGGGGGGDGGPPGGGDGTLCEASGPAFELPFAPQLALTTGADGYVALQEEGGFASGEWATWVFGDGEPIRFEGGIGRTPLAVATGPTGAVGVSFQISPLEPRVRLRRWDGEAWTRAGGDSSGELDREIIFARAGGMAVSANGDAAVAWLHDRGSPDSPEVTAYIVVQRAGTFGPPETVFTPADTLSDNEVHVAAGPDGAVHVLGHQYRDEAVTMIYRQRNPDGEWGPIVPVGPAPGTLGNTTVTDIVVAGDGSVYVAEAHGSTVIDFREDPNGGVVVYRIDGDAAERIGGVDDPRFRAAGLAMASLGDRVAIAVTHGQNNFDAAESEDSVDLYVCSAAGCGLAAQPSTVKGIFYRDIALAARGDEVAVLWTQEPKRGVEAPAAHNRKRFACP